MSWVGAALATVDAAVGTAIGLLAATSLGTLFYLGSCINVLAARMDAGFGKVDTRFDSLAARIDVGFARIDVRLDAMETRLNAHVDRHASSRRPPIPAVWISGVGR